MNTIAGDYVKLALELDLYDPDYVDAYSGPAEWKPAARKIDKAESFPAKHFQQEAVRLIADLEKIDRESLDHLERQRVSYLRAHLRALKARADQLAGAQMSFDAESWALYDITAPRETEEYFAPILARLDQFLPGEGDPVQRYREYCEGFIVPREKIDTVFKAAIAEARRRTSRWIRLPEHEDFSIEYVQNQPWGAYNWYLGNARSLIQINIDLPIYVGSIIQLAAHEGYPGHHVQSTLVETHLARDKNWVEFTLYPLYAPSALLYEGGANCGVDLAFPDNDRLAFERDVLYPLAGLDPSQAEHYFLIRRLTKQLGAISTQVARQYLDGEMTAQTARAWLMEYGLYTWLQAEQAIKFYERYRSYILNYYYGERLVRDYLARRAASAGSPEQQWILLTELLTIPCIPSELAALAVH